MFTFQVEENWTFETFWDCSYFAWGDTLAWLSLDEIRWNECIVAVLFLRVVRWDASVGIKLFNQVSLSTRKPIDMASR